MRERMIRGALRGMLAALFVIGLTACGHTTGSAGPVGTVGTTPPTQGVVVTLDATSYGPADAITLTVLNQLGSEIIATDHHSSCTIVQLKREVNGAWQDVGGCALGMATRQISLAAGSSTHVTLAPGAGQISAKPWPAGTYRVAFTYQPGPIGATSGEGTTVYSVPFTVGQ